MIGFDGMIRNEKLMHRRRKQNEKLFETPLLLKMKVPSSSVSEEELRKRAFHPNDTLSSHHYSEASNSTTTLSSSTSSAAKTHFSEHSSTDTNSTRTRDSSRSSNASSNGKIESNDYSLLPSSSIMSSPYQQEGEQSTSETSRTATTPTTQKEGKKNDELVFYDDFEDDISLVSYFSSSPEAQQRFAVSLSSLISLMFLSVVETATFPFIIPSFYRKGQIFVNRRSLLPSSWKSYINFRNQLRYLSWVPFNILSVPQLKAGLDWILALFHPPPVVTSHSHPVDSLRFSFELVEQIDEVIQIACRLTFLICLEPEGSDQLWKLVAEKEIPKKDFKMDLPKTLKEKDTFNPHPEKRISRQMNKNDSDGETFEANAERNAAKYLIVDMCRLELYFYFVCSLLSTRFARREPVFDEHDRPVLYFSPSQDIITDQLKTLFFLLQIVQIGSPHPRSPLHSIEEGDHEKTYDANDDDDSYYFCSTDVDSNEELQLALQLVLPQHFSRTPDQNTPLAIQRRHGMHISLVMKNLIQLFVASALYFGDLQSYSSAIKATFDASSSSDKQKNSFYSLLSSSRSKSHNRSPSPSHTPPIITPLHTYSSTFSVLPPMLRKHILLFLRLLSRLSLSFRTTAQYHAVIQSSIVSVLSLLHISFNTKMSHHKLRRNSASTPSSQSSGSSFSANNTSTPGHSPTSSSPSNPSAQGSTTDTMVPSTFLMEFLLSIALRVTPPEIPSEFGPLEKYKEIGQYLKKAEEAERMHEREREERRKARRDSSQAIQNNIQPPPAEESSNASIEPSTEFLQLIGNYENYTISLSYPPQPLLSFRTLVDSLAPFVRSLFLFVSNPTDLSAIGIIHQPPNTFLISSIEAGNPVAVATSSTLFQTFSSDSEKLRDPFEKNTSLLHAFLDCCCRKSYFLSLSLVIRSFFPLIIDPGVLPSFTESSLISPQSENQKELVVLWKTKNVADAGMTAHDEFDLFQTMDCSCYTDFRKPCLFRTHHANSVSSAASMAQSEGANGLPMIARGYQPSQSGLNGTESSFRALPSTTAYSILYLIVTTLCSSTPQSVSSSAFLPLMPNSAPVASLIPQTATSKHPSSSANSCFAVLSVDAHREVEALPLLADAAVLMLASVQQNTLYEMMSQLFASLLNLVEARYFWQKKMPISENVKAVIIVLLTTVSFYWKERTGASDSEKKKYKKIYSTFVDSLNKQFSGKSSENLKDFLNNLSDSMKFSTMNQLAEEASRLEMLLFPDHANLFEVLPFIE